MASAVAVIRIRENLRKDVGLTFVAAHWLAQCVAFRTPFWLADGCVVDPAIIRRLGIRGNA